MKISLAENIVSCTRKSSRVHTNLEEDIIVIHHPLPFPFWTICLLFIITLFSLLLHAILFRIFKGCLFGETVMQGQEHIVFIFSNFNCVVLDCFNASYNAFYSQFRNWKLFPSSNKQKRVDKVLSKLDRFHITSTLIILSLSVTSSRSLAKCNGLTGTEFGLYLCETRTYVEREIAILRVRSEASLS